MERVAQRENVRIASENVVTIVTTAGPMPLAVGAIRNGESLMAIDYQKQYYAARKIQIALEEAAEKARGVIREAHERWTQQALADALKESDEL